MTKQLKPKINNPSTFNKIKLFNNSSLNENQYKKTFLTYNPEKAEGQYIQIRDIILHFRDFQNHILNTKNQ